jgi:hypothetical protein
VFLDAQHRVIGFEVLYAGTLTQTSVSPREIVKEALTYSAAARSSRNAATATVKRLAGRVFSAAGQEATQAYPQGREKGPPAPLPDPRAR